MPTATAIPDGAPEPDGPATDDEGGAAPAGDPGAAPTGGGRTPWGPLTGVALAASIVAYVVAIALTIGKGFNPTDEGLIVSYASRLLAGDVPHRDFIFSRPVGSSLLHTIDVVLPTPLLMTGRVFGAAQIYVYTLLFAALAAGRRVRSLHPLLLAGVVVAAIVNVHTLPLMSWYTIDGLFLVAVGAYVLRWTERRWARWAALFLLGYAPLCKQSFFLAPVIGLWFLLRYHRPERRLVRIVVDLVFLGLPGLLYLVWVTATGALRPMLDQFKGVPPVFGKSLLDDLSPLPRGALVPVVGVAVVAGVWGAAVLAHRRWGAEGAPIAARIGLAVGALAVMALPAVVIWRAKFDLGAVYGSQLFWLGLATVAIGAALRRRFYDGVLLAPLAGWMAALSIGYPKPNYAVGSIALAVAVPVWQDVATAIGPVAWLSRPGLAVRRIVTVVGVAGLALVVSLPLIAVRNDHLYRERPAAELVWDLGQVDGDLAGISTNAVTYEYLRSMKECVERVRADGAVKIAVVPDNPAMYPVLDLDNPLPINSLYPQEFYGSERRVIDAFAALNTSPERVAILYQVFDPAVASVLDEMPQAGPGIPVHAHFYPPLFEAVDQQRGDRSYCGPFVIIESGGTGS